jgi:diadenosine tetraphosphatase ApaH/serine/threonine PP2A family protein phosphatase
MKRLFSAFAEELCFCGHTHVPGVFLPEGRFLTPKELPGGQFVRDGRRAILNVGSVGQPRDGDPRASYVTFDRTAVWFHRVPYDYRKTQEKIRLIPALPAMLAERLEKGR